ncbi:MAG: isoaspartyl peptidase/L-asparaginase [Trichodesmium sp. St16_bin4-tuft]|uniref:Asparaginase n=1 Tax=Trichodesmium erythraeum (strain IMS101) TaxID=203124 RepID=Q119T2_TRIEI|nr:isoaspartyl peptidase/L-asparaginase [Trichodesmium erythraeum GBRTRLIN201]MDE5069705.1 isoaspartyl peptidase/L-asparaginase [Trichodesmium sp. St4_bin8_1]MDE5070942.1 isoaspartyl peptidase/L-asparaginase [Trichodesmium sp. St5_bin8]MDE5078773.1 isoaspartyl peptidase/L-asparaginase [Trichodesmium sp. St2_bin6]MDE5100811.1 isoaspartyl peptidase/L-asparaginase [Trichodesmium sp. St16_bin4-tuft]MDE5103392.1 isoaspartyl peptidase/L-asparaginase [Trichodesmium sp. St19_bin2]
MQPKLIIHGGAGSSLDEKGGLEIVRKSLHRIVDELYNLLLGDTAALDIVIRGCQMLEDDPIFNAGTGSVLQSDGQIRMSASLMDGLNHRFSGVINVSRIKNPIDLARALQESPDRVLSDSGAAEFVRELQMPVYNPLTDKRLNEWLEDRKQNFNRKMANVVTVSPGTGTIGVVALDKEGRLAAGTSTGGKGFEKIGRVSDSAMPAGNYATDSAAVSCTGIGEDIIDECLAAKIVIRVTDGFSIKAAFERSFAEAHEHKRDLGAIGIDAGGTINWGKTCDVILAAFHDGEKIGDSLEADKGKSTFSVE